MVELKSIIQPLSTSLENIIDIQKIPLLLAYPTALQASNFIFNKQENIDLPIYHVLSLTVLIIPLFLASASIAVHRLITTSTVIRKKEVTTWESNQVVLALYGLFAAAWILGSVRTVTLSLVLIMNVHLPFVLLSLLFDMCSLYMKDKLHFLTLELSKSNLYFIIGAYVTLFLIKDTLRNVDRLNVESNIFTVLITAITSGAVLIWQSEKLHLSMILVTIGCVCVLNISKSDMTAVGFKRGSVTIMSVISIVLEILALNSDYTGSYLLTIFEFALTAITLIIEVDEDLFKIEHSMEPNVNIIQQLYLHEDTRAIFSFLLLNASFMLVQFLYSFRSKSLGLLSDSLHMALDCTSLALGLVAGVLAKKPPSESFPFGLSKIETLAGFANGVLLIGIVAGIVIEAIERIITPVSLEKTGELLIVSFLGFVVNIVGIFAFNHGHDHGHGGHSHAHSHSHSSSESSNENMHGIFLHILADTLGSAGVVVSTLLTSFFHSNIFDPIASLFIAIMIFVSAIPLVRSSARNLLLNLDDKKDEQIRDILSQIVTTPGIVGYSTPRFWNSPDIAISSSFNQGKSHSVDHKHQDEAHSHSHEHTHEHQPTHEHEHTHECEHSHSHELTHELEHSHTESECKGKTFSMVGFIHIQYLNGENSTIIKKRVQKIFENNNINAVIQVENENSSCWCRAASTS